MSCTSHLITLVKNQITRAGNGFKKLSTSRRDLLQVIMWRRGKNQISGTSKCLPRRCTIPYSLTNSVSYDIDLDGIGVLTGLVKLSLCDNSIADVEPLAMHESIEVFYE
jgi:hypothetical protein